MLMLRKIHGLTVAVLALCLTSCIESKNPLSDPDRSIPDPQLYGVWIHKKEGVTTTMVIGRANEIERKDVPVGIMRATKSSIDSKGLVSSPTEWTFFASALDSGGYMNRFDPSALNYFKYNTWDKWVIENYTLVKYRVSGDKLEVWVGSETALGNAIQRGDLGGEVIRNKNNAVIRGKLTASTDNLVNYINQGGTNILFPDSTKDVYIRILSP
jgi:hypothetical protein